MNPLSLCPPTLCTMAFGCAPQLPHVHTRSSKPRGSHLPLRSCYLPRNHPDNLLLTITHTQSASLSQFHATSFAHVRITIASHSHRLLEHNSFALFALLADLELRLILLGCANLLVRTVSALSSMRTSVALPVARPSQHCNTDCFVHLTTNALQALPCRQTAIQTGACSGSRNHGEPALASSPSLPCPRSLTCAALRWLHRPHSNSSSPHPHC